MDKILYLEKRGCDFLDDTPECLKSDLENFRLFGYVESVKKLAKNKSDDVYCIEICTHFFKKHHNKKIPENSVVSFFNVSYEDDKGNCYGYVKSPEHFSIYSVDDYALVNRNNKADVLSWVNDFFGTDYKELLIIDTLPEEIRTEEKKRQDRRLLKWDFSYLSDKLSNALEREKAYKKVIEKHGVLFVGGFSKLQNEIKDLKNKLEEVKKNLQAL